MATLDITGRHTKSNGPESSNPNEPGWNLVAVFWGVLLIGVVALVISFGSIFLHAPLAH